MTITPTIGLIYLDILVNGRFTVVMVDTGAIYKFVLLYDMRSLGIILENEELHMKSVNSKTKPISGVA